MTAYGVYVHHGTWNLQTVALHPATAEEVRVDAAERNPGDRTAVVTFATERDMPASVRGCLYRNPKFVDVSTFASADGNDLKCC